MARSNFLQLLEKAPPTAKAVDKHPASTFNMAPGDKLTPGDKLKRGATRAAGYVLADGTTVDGRFVHPENLAQAGHTSSEHQVYQALWRAGGGDSDTGAYRDVSVGQTAIARQASISKRNLIRIIESLHAKFSIETLQLQTSSDHTAKTYRVWSMKEILGRRRARGYGWVYRNRNVVALAQDINLSPGVSLSPPLGTSSLGSKEELSSSSVVAAAVRKVAPEADDDAVALLVGKCRTVAPDATEDEIAYFTRVKAEQGINSRRVRNLVGFLLESVPRCLEGTMLQNYRAAICQERDRERATWQGILNDPNETEDFKQMAREALARLVE